MEYRLSVGFNGDKELLDRMFSDKDNKIDTLYTGGFLKSVSSGRFQYSDDEKRLEQIAGDIHDKGAKVAVTLNSPCNVPPMSEKEWWLKVKEYLKTLEKIGIDTAIIAHPFLMATAKEYTDLQIAASIICDINSVRGALYYEDMGADIVVPSSSINYDIELLKNIKNNLRRAEIKLLVNEACLGNCPWRRFHQNALAHADRKGYDSDYAANCTRMYTEHPHLMLTNNVVRPEDLERYEGICNFFKLVGRTTDDETLLKMIHAYSVGHYDGNLVDIVDKGFSKMINLPNQELGELFDQKANCMKNCQTCDSCKTLYKRINKR